jgi:hypothetical protein
VTEPLLRWAAWLDNWTFVGLLALVVWPLLLFPTGTLPSPRWRPLGALVFVATAAIALAGMLDPGKLENATGYRKPLPGLGVVGMDQVSRRVRIRHPDRRDLWDGRRSAAGTSRSWPGRVARALGVASARAQLRAGVRARHWWRRLRGDADHVGCGLRGCLDDRGASLPHGRGGRGAAACVHRRRCGRREPDRLPRHLPTGRPCRRTLAWSNWRHSCRCSRRRATPQRRRQTSRPPPLRPSRTR